MSAPTYQAPQPVTHAFIDESIRGGRAGVYVLAAAVVSDSAVETARTALRSVLRPRQPRFHWRDEADDQRIRMLEALTLSRVEPRAAAFALDGERQERGRVHCLQGLLADLNGLGVSHLVFETREEHNDAKDRKAIALAQRGGWIAADMRYEFRRPRDEPLLWAADAIAGAVSAHRFDGRSDYVDRLASHGVLDVSSVRV
jgi:hypothetical protein